MISGDSARSLGRIGPIIIIIIIIIDVGGEARVSSDSADYPFSVLFISVVYLGLYMGCYLFSSEGVVCLSIDKGEERKNKEEIRKKKKIKE